MKTLQEQVAERLAWRRAHPQREEQDAPAQPRSAPKPAPKRLPTVESLAGAKHVYREILDELKVSSRCAVVIGMETDYAVIRMEAVDSWIQDPTRRARFLFVANQKTSLEDVEWLLQR